VYFIFLSQNPSFQERFITGDSLFSLDRFPSSLPPSHLHFFPLAALFQPFFLHVAAAGIVEKIQ
jgi:hypothetical protein